MINHRGPEFKEMLYRVTDGLKSVFETESDLYILTASGTGAMEAAIVNTLSPGDKVLCVSVGSFGDRFGQIAEIYGADVTILSSPPGTATDPAEVRSALQRDESVKAVLVTHNETSTGVANDLEAIAGIAKGEFGKLVLVDGISSVCSLTLRADAWGCDVVATASQKGWMLPPGLAFVSFSPRAWEAYATSTMPKFYFDMAQYRKYYELGQPPYTPSVSVMFALDYALERILEEGMEAISRRHAVIAQRTRDGLRALGLSLFADEGSASDTVTAARVPEGVDAKELVRVLRQEYDVVMAPGQGPLTSQIVRIGHMGDTSSEDIDAALSALGSALSRVAPETSGAGARAS
jgi:aspartate aminotransferase-like enzyme